MDWKTRYPQYRELFRGQRFPLAFVDLERFDRNIDYVAQTQAGTGKTIRVASKSIRCPDLLRRVFHRGGKAFQGILAYTVEEAAFLLDQGFDDIVVAYPSVQSSDLEILAHRVRQGADISLMADSLDQLERIHLFGEACDTILPVCLDMDMSWRPLGGIHLGVRRSPLHRPDQILALADALSQLSHVRLHGLMGYEAQVASVNDAVPGQGVKNALMRWIKARSGKELARRRGAVVRALKDKGFDLKLVNGGGSGSLKSTGQDASVTEVTAGSAFFAPGLFWHFKDVAFEPAAFFALQVARIPAPGLVTCQGGGYAASGEAGTSRLPRPVMPPGLSYLPLEGAGEVQTPLALPKGHPGLDMGEPVFFQHAKAGELCEHFNEIQLIHSGKITGRATTYRGHGKAFL